MTGSKNAGSYLRFRKFLRGRMFSWDGVLDRGSGDSGANFLTRFGRPALAGAGTAGGCSMSGSKSLFCYEHSPLL